MADYCEILSTEKDRLYLLCDKLRSEDGLVVKDRSYKFKTYPSCFIGSELVDYLICEGIANDRIEAVFIGQQLIDYNLIHHVLDNHPFKDDYLFFRFRDDDPIGLKLSKPGPSVASLLSDCGVSIQGYVLKKGIIKWNKRFMVLKQDESKLYYYTTDLDSSPRQVVDLDDLFLYVQEIPNLKKKHYCFRIVTEKTNFDFAFQQSKDQISWLEALTNAGVKMKQFQEEEEILRSHQNIHQFRNITIEGQEISLSKYKNKVVLIVNVASK
eukprot:TRINITY_DN1883_c0_g4_i1.p1 TRINITY_DN1883_c0_g4~~TRINITY_DN1883_c0_g4_i1.p1  ORF type:complete len:268 (+),score=62.57 TRINITY_DN1883_c0_g4_i1:58-861(+)